MDLQRSGAYFHKGTSTYSSTVEEEQRAVAYLTRRVDDADELRDLIDLLGLRDTAESMTERRSA